MKSVRERKTTRTANSQTTLPVGIIAPPLSELPVRGQSLFCLPLWCINLKIWRTVAASWAELPRSGGGQKKIWPEVGGMVPGDVQAFWPSAPMQTALMVDPPLSLAEVLHERDAPHRRRWLALGLLERDGPRAQAQASFGTVLRSRNRDCVGGTCTLF